MFIEVFHMGETAIGVLFLLYQYLRKAWAGSIISYAIHLVLWEFVGHHLQEKLIKRSPKQFICIPLRINFVYFLYPQFSSNLNGKWISGTVHSSLSPQTYCLPFKLCPRVEVRTHSNKFGNYNCTGEDYSSV